VEDWHLEWYRTEPPQFYKGQAAFDCPLCGQPVGWRQGKIGPAPAGVPVVRRYADKAAEWAELQHGVSLQAYLSVPPAGIQYTAYWPPAEVQQADAVEQAKKRP
jgi:hypothetical protein